MAKGKRVKPVLVQLVIKSVQEADSTLARIAAIKRDIQIINTGMEEDVAQIKLKAADQIAPYQQKLTELEAALVYYAKTNKPVLFKTRKSIAVPFGKFGFHASTALKTDSKSNWAQVLERLKKRKMDDYIRIKEEVDKEKVKGLEDKVLKELGCKLVKVDTFFYETAEHGVEADFNDGVNELADQPGGEDGPGQAA